MSPKAFICPRGHLWTSPDPLGVVVEVCPICGAAGELLSADPGDPATLKHVHGENPTVVVAGSKGDLAALHASDGSVAWSAPAAGPLGASPAVDHGRIFVPTLTGRLPPLPANERSMPSQPARQREPTPILAPFTRGAPSIRSRRQPVSGPHLVMAHHSPRPK